MISINARIILVLEQPEIGSSTQYTKNHISVGKDTG